MQCQGFASAAREASRAARNGLPARQFGWPGTKNDQDHRVWLPEAARAVIADVSGGDTGFVFGGRRPVTGLDGAMREICTVRVGSVQFTTGTNTPRRTRR